MPSFAIIITLFASVVAVLMYSYNTLPFDLESQGLGKAPNKFSVRAIFSAGHLFIFILLIFLVNFGVNYQIMIGVLNGDTKINELDGLFSGAGAAYSGSGNARTIDVENILTSTAFFFGLFGFKKWREIEAGVLRQLQSISMNEEDVGLLENNLILCDSHASYSDNCGSARALDRLQERVLDEGKPNPSKLSRKWVKVNALLDIWQKHPEWGNTLPDGEKLKIDVAQKTHDRKSTLALKIEAHVKSVERGEAGPEALAEIASQIYYEEEKNRAKGTDIATNSLDRLKGPDAPSSGKLLKDFLKPLVDYLGQEYDELLSELAHVSAKSAVYAGDETNSRLKILKNYGFSNIGKYDHIELHKAFLISFCVFFGTAIILYAVPLILSGLGVFPPRDQSNFFPFVLALGLTVATMVGAMVGGLRTLAAAPVTPWGIYIVAALAAGLMYSLIILGAISMGVTPPSAAGGTSPFSSPAFFVIVTIFPITIVLGICTLSRNKRFPPDCTRLKECLRDSLCLGGMLAGAGMVLILFAVSMQIEPPRQGMSAPERMLIVGAISAIMGTSIGSVIPFVRDAAHSKIVSDN